MVDDAPEETRARKANVTAASTKEAPQVREHHRLDFVRRRLDRRRTTLAAARLRGKSCRQRTDTGASVEQPHMISVHTEHPSHERRDRRWSHELSQDGPSISIQGRIRFEACLVGTQE
ncbi:MAG: hypothetical protein ACKVWV_09990 [Planctomycetota bacterium]